MNTKLERLSKKTKAGIRWMTICIPRCEYEETWCDRNGWQCTMVHQQFAVITLHGRIAEALQPSEVGTVMERLWTRGTARCDI